MTTKTFETTNEAKEFGLTRCQSLCKPDRELCNPQFGQERKRWRNCLKFRLSLCQYYSYTEVPGLKEKAYISSCNNLSIAFDFCLGKECEELPKIVIEEEQPVTFYYGASAPKGTDYKQRAAKDDSSL